jgi:hypothetical protein
MVVCVRKQRMTMQRSRVEERLGDIKEEEVSSATKYVIDSVYEDKFRVLVSRLRKPIPKSEGVNGLARFDVWEAVGGDDLLIRSKKDAFKELGIMADQVEEGRVFVRFSPGDNSRAVEITEFVREESKSHYLALVKKERTRGRRMV